MPRFTRPPPPQLTPPYAKKFAEWSKKFETGTQEPDTVTRCLAFGIARFGTMPMEIIQTPGQITMNLGVLHDIRRIYMDGIGHTVGADPSFNGDSVGRWEGDTLVVETNNIRAGTIDRDGIPYSDKLTVVERIRRVSRHAPGNRDDADRSGSLRGSLHHQACVHADAAGQPLRGIPVREQPRPVNCRRASIMRKTTSLLLAALALPLVAVAHHSFAMFDMAKSVNYKGTVKEVQWTNPHVWVELDVTDGWQDGDY